MELNWLIYICKTNLKIRYKCEKQGVMKGFFEKTDR